jgi:hypothetical protein
VARGERPIKLGDSWFSAKSIEVDRRTYTLGGRALDGLGGPKDLPNLTKLRIPRRFMRQTDGGC